MGVAGGSRRLLASATQTAETQESPTLHPPLSKHPQLAAPIRHATQRPASHRLPRTQVRSGKQALPASPIVSTQRLLSLQLNPVLHVLPVLQGQLRAPGVQVDDTQRPAWHVRPAAMQVFPV